MKAKEQAPEQTELTAKQLAYRNAIATFTPQLNSDCENYKKAMQFAKDNGYEFWADVSYNGFIELRKEICKSDNPHDGNRLDIKVYDDVIKKDHCGHDFEQLDMEIDFENDSILKPMKYRFKRNHDICTGKMTKDIDRLLTFALLREKELVAEFEQFLLDNPTTEWKMTDPDNFQYGRLNRGVPEFKEFDREKIPDLFNKMKQATQERVDIYLNEHFNEEFLWIQKKIILSMYSDEERNDFAKDYYKDLSELKEIYGKDWEFILAECIFEQENFTSY